MVMIMSKASLEKMLGEIWKRRLRMCMLPGATESGFGPVKASVDSAVCVSQV